MELKSNELKKIQVNILKEVHCFCEKHGIKYYISYGTLLGAVRHKGYIPWDDDIDICMPRPDYEKFMKLFNDKENKYKFVTYELDNNFLYTFGKVMDTSTKLIEDSTNKYFLGINIDVFPIDGIDNNIKILKKQILLAKFLSIKIVKYSKKRDFFKNLILILGKVLLSPIPTKVFIKKMIKNSKMNSYEDAKKVCCIVFGDKADKPVPKEYFGDGKMVFFEDQYFYAPTEYDSYLRSIYGDYMKLPPKEERITHHSFRAYRIENK